MGNWSSIHIYGSGESQIVGKALSTRVPNTSLTTLDPLLQYLSAIQKSGVTGTDGLHAVNIINGQYIDVIPKITGKAMKSVKDSYGVKIQMKDVDASYVNALADELAGKAGKRAKAKKK